MKITYRQVGDYQIPNLTLPPEKAGIHLGKWGLLYKDYLKKNAPLLFSTFLIQGKLYQHISEVEKQAQKMFDTLVEQMMKLEDITEEMKEKDQMEWVCRVQNIESRAREIVCNELIFQLRG